MSESDVGFCDFCTPDTWCEYHGSDPALKDAGTPAEHDLFLTERRRVEAEKKATRRRILERSFGLS